MTQLSLDFCQRWMDRREYRRFPAECINPAEFGIDVFRKEGVPRAFIEQHHYSASYPAAHCAIGLYRKTGVHPSRLVGVAVFSEGVRSADAMPHWTGFERQNGTELGRLVLLPEVLHNGESWFIARAFEALRAEKPHISVVLSYCDPVERTTIIGQRVKPGHFGSIYQASNALYVGRSSPKTLLLLPDGRVLHPYTMHKAIHKRRGWESARRTLEQVGGPPASGETVEGWIERIRASLRPMRHPGNFVYVFGLESVSWRRLRAKHGKGLPYPKEKHGRTC